MGQTMVGRVAIRARQVRPGDAVAAVVPAGGLVEIIDLEGQQVAELVAFNRSDLAEHVSLGVTRQRSKSFVFQLGMSLYSSRGNAMLELVEDTVGRHDLLWSAPTGAIAAAGHGEPATTTPTVIAGSDDSSSAGESSRTSATPAAADEPVADGEAVGDAETTAVVEPLSAESPSPTPDQLPVEAPGGFASALGPFGLDATDAPDPINFFMNLGIMQKGDLELRVPTSERGDRVLLRATTELLVAVRCSSATDETNGENPTDILVRIYR